MPVKSAKQFRFMEMIAHNKGGMKKATGPSPEVAEEFLEKTPKKKKTLFAKQNRPRI